MRPTARFLNWNSLPEYIKLSTKSLTLDTLDQMWGFTISKCNYLTWGSQRPMSKLNQQYHERETRQLEGFYSVCFASMCIIWLVVRRIPVSAVLGILMPALLQSPVWQGWNAAWKQLALYHGDKPREEGQSPRDGLGRKPSGRVHGSVL